MLWKVEASTIGCTIVPSTCNGYNLEDQAQDWHAMDTQEE